MELPKSTAPQNDLEDEMTDPIKATDTLAKKIAALFAQAASASERAKLGDETGEAEAEAFLMRAQKLMAQHSIDEEMVRQADKARNKTSEQPVRKDFYLDEGPYRKSRCLLAAQIGSVMGLSTRLANSGAYVVYIGFKSDADAAWAMFQMIEPQMVAGADRRVKGGAHLYVRDHTTRSGYVSAKSWKLTYFEGYTSRIVGRLFQNRREAEESVVFAEGVTDAKGITSGRVTGTMVLASRREVVKAFEERLFPVAKTKTGRAKKPTYWKAPQASKAARSAFDVGRHDGDQARIRHGAELHA